jgi:hypothetical protein
MREENDEYLETLNFTKNEEERTTKNGDVSLVAVLNKCLGIEITIADEHK